MNTLAPETGFLFAGICYVAWWYLCGKIITKGLFSIHASEGSLGYVLYKRILAVFFFFLLPLVFLRFTHQNFLDWFSLSNVYETAIVSIAISAPLIIINLNREAGREYSVVSRNPNGAMGSKTYPVKCSKLDCVPFCL